MSNIVSFYNENEKRIIGQYKMVWNWDNIKILESRKYILWWLRESKNLTFV